MTDRATILGDGQMALALADVLTERGLVVRMWGPVAADAQKLASSRRSARLPEFDLPDGLEITADDVTALEGADVVVSAIPTQFLRSVWQRLQPYVPGDVPIVSVTKGIENGTLMRPTQVIADVLNVQKSKRPNVHNPPLTLRSVGTLPLAPGPAGGKNSAPSTQHSALVALSGPCIAAELARRLPASLVAASENGASAQLVQDLFRVPWLRVYRHDDVIGVETAGATKNIIALAAGMVDGMEAGSNAKSALLARGLAEIARLGMAMGAKLDTFFGIAGVGDLATSCFSPEGRNRTCGERLSRGESLDSILASMSSVVEGVPTTKSVMELARSHGVDMPITAAVHAILFEGLSPHQAIRGLMNRDLKAEHVG